MYLQTVIGKKTDVRSCLTLYHSLQVLLAGVPLLVSRSCPAAGGRRVSLPMHRCEDVANIVPLSAGVASGCALPSFTILPDSWWPQGEPA
jgi:hypothetical protein